MLVTFIFAFEIAAIQICMVTTPLIFPFFDPLPPQVRVLRIDLKVLASLSVCAWMGGEDQRRQVCVKILYW